MINTIVHGDCLDVMRGMDDNSVDLVLTDPPYGQNLSGGRSSKDGWDNKIDWNLCNKEWNNTPGVNIFQEIVRVSKNQIIWGGNYFAKMLENSECWLIWDKGQRNFSLADAELAWTSFDKAVRVFNYDRAAANKKKRFHPTQKPVALFTWCLSKYSKENDLILDCFSGSGTTAIACHRMNRRFICIEKEEKYVKLSRKRLKIEQMQERLEL